MAYRPIKLEAQRNFLLRSGVLWDVIANTNDLDREIGLPAVAFGPVVVSADGFYRQAASHLFGRLPLRWREYPFEWVRGERYAVLRTFEAGFLDTFYGGAEVSPKGEETLIRIFAEVTPRTLIGVGIARLMGRKGMRDTLAYCERSVANQQMGVDLLAVSSKHMTPADQPALDQLEGALRMAPLPEHLVKRFIRHLASAPDSEVIRMRPYALADGWGADRMEVLRLFMQAARLGGLYVTWEIMCPNCRVPRDHAKTPAGVPSRFHCDVCAVDYDTDLAENVELRYSVHPAIRMAKDEVYCIGGPSNSPHVWVQQYLLPGTERNLSVTLTDEAFRARVLKVNASCPLEPEPGGPSEVSFTYRDDGWYQLRQRFSPGRVNLRLSNEAAHVAVVVIEQVRWDPLAITAAQVMSLPEFHELAAAAHSPHNA